MTFNNKQEISINNNYDIVEGVAVKIKDTKGNLLLVLEGEDKPWKKQGQWSCIMETMEENEIAIEAVKRGIKEEIGLDITYDKIVSLDKFLKFHVFTDTKTIIVRLYLYELTLDNKDLSGILKFNSPEISKVKFFSKDEILYYLENDKKFSLRPGNKDIIFDFLNRNEIFIKNGYEI